MRAPAVILAVLTLLLGLFCLRESRLGTFDTAENRFLSWLVANSETPPASPDLVLFNLQNSASTDSEEHPFTPRECVRFFEAVAHFDPPVVVTNPVPRWDPPQPGGESSLLQRALVLQRLVTATTLSTAPPEDEETFPSGMNSLRNVSGNTSSIPEFRSFQAEPFNELTVGSTRGLRTEQSLGRGTYPLLFSFRGEIVPSILLQTIMLWKKSTSADVEVRCGESVKVGESLTIPIDNRGCLTINGALRNAIPKFSVDDLIFASEESQAGKPILDLPETKLRGGISILETKTESAADLATAIATIQSGLYIRPAPETITYGIILGLVAFSLFLQSRSRFSSLLLCASLLGVYAIGASWIFGATQMRLPFVIPAGLCFLIALGKLILGKPNAVEDSGVK